MENFKDFEKYISAMKEQHKAFKVWWNTKDKEDERAYIKAKSIADLIKTRL